MLGGFGKAIKAATGATLVGKAAKAAKQAGPKKTAAALTPLGMTLGAGALFGPGTEQRLRARRASNRQSTTPRMVTK